MKRIAIIVAMMLAAVTHVQAQNLRLGEKVPSINVDSKLGKELNLGTKEYVCMIFIHSESLPCIKAFADMGDMRTTLLDNLDIVLVTTEQRDIEADIAQRIDTLGMTLAFDTERKTFKAFGINYVPFCVIFDKRRSKAQWFGPVNQLNRDIILEITNN